ncbi:uncharacterized protein LOC105433466, partial [Pogonomyrmex barbatus]|uniref:Uncharacterized protein LOC105433466 n=1 Tax=Pogonomyrmex barbatus TaxID=144034 RepID=A0A6I9WUW2_9HYME
YDFFFLQNKGNKDRKPLQVLQPAATDNEMLVGTDRILRSTKSQRAKTKQDVETVKKDTSQYLKVTKKNKAVQTAWDRIKIKDLTSTDNPSENYWQILADRRQIALVDALEENKILVQRIAKKEEEIRVYKEMLEETKALAETLQELYKEDKNDVNHSLDDSNL